MEFRKKYLTKEINVKNPQMKLLKLHIDQNVNSKLIKIKENSTKNSKTPIKRNSVSPRLKRTFNIHSTIAQPLISHKKSLSSIYEPKCKESRKKINLNLSIDDSLSEINAVETPSTEKDDSVVNSNFLDESLSSYYTQDTFLQSSYSSTTPIQFLFSYEKHGYSSRVSPIEWRNQCYNNKTPVLNPPRSETPMIPTQKVEVEKIPLFPEIKNKQKQIMVASKRNYNKSVSPRALIYATKPRIEVSRKRQQAITPFPRRY